MSFSIRLRRTDMLQDLAGAVNANTRNWRILLDDLERELHRLRGVAGDDEERNRTARRLDKLLSPYRVGGGTVPGIKGPGG